MTRLLNIWRSWSVRRRLITVGVATLAVAGSGFAAYEIVKRPADISNPDATFVETPEKKKVVKTVDWPVYGYDEERTRYLPSKEVRPPFGDSNWSYVAGKLLEFSPVVARGLLYLIDKDGVVIALDADRGKVKWKRDMGSLNASSPAYANGTVYGVTLDPGQAFALRARDGKVLWRHPLPGRSETSPVVHNDRVIVGSESGDIFALDTKNGAVRWQVSTGGAVKGGAALHKGTLYVGNYAGELYAIDASNGQVKWQNGTQGGSFGVTGRIYSTPAVAFGRVYVGSVDSRVYSFEADSGELAWSQSTGDWVYPAPAVADTPESPPTVYIGSKDKHFYALDAEDGSVRWDQDLGGIILGAASVIGETVYVAGIGPNVGTFGFRVKDGDTVFEHDLGEYNPVISDGHRLYLTGTSGIRAFEHRSRKERREARKRNEQKKREKKQGRQEQGDGQGQGK
jgi:outer membrane protein assembly factor BamB